jgi:diguanylate cyclase (GGDEF)-like protein
VPLTFSWPLAAVTALVGVLTFTMLGCSLRRMRSHDRVSVLVWWLSGVWTTGAGLWATWALGLCALAPPPGVPPPCLQPGWLATLAAAAAAPVALLHAAARAPMRAELRGAALAAGFTAAWAACFECARRALGDGLAQPRAGDGLPVPAVALLVVAAAAAIASWLAAGRRWRGIGALPRLWAAASLLAAAHTGALLAALGDLRLTPAAADGAPPPPGTSAGTLLLVCAIAAMLVVVGLVCSWLDTHAHARNRQLADSLSEANRRLREQAHFDALTRLPNRLMFEERMKAALAAAGAQPDACSIAVLFIDLDGFKPINDSFGHVAGDAVLREIGRRLQAVARPGDTVARVGGDEFLMMTPRPGHEAVAASVAQRLLEALNEPLTLPNDVTVNLSGSIGIVLYPEHGPASKLIANADAAMYAAKRAGGSTYAFFEPRMELDAREQLALQNELRHAIERGELQLYYQPKIDGRSGQITGVESLLRWQHPVRGFVPPGLFIPIAERFGLIGAIGNWVIDEACRQLREWRRQGLRMRVAVNLSVHQLRQEDLVQRVRVAVDHFGVEPQLLTFEITESVAMEDTQETMRAFAQLASVGVSLSIDDFGTGYSSLAYLRKLPARQLKIDQSFVQDLGASPDALAVVDAVIRLAHALGLRVVAEGVETPRQRDILLGLRCDELQGYLFARPMPARMLTLWATGEPPAGARAPAAEPGEPARGDFRPSLFLDDGAPEAAAGSDPIASAS